MAGAFVSISRKDYERMLILPMATNSHRVGCGDHVSLKSKLVDYYEIEQVSHATSIDRKHFPSYEEAQTQLTE